MFDFARVCSNGQNGVWPECGGIGVLSHCRLVFLYCNLGSNFHSLPSHSSVSDCIMILGDHGVYLVLVGRTLRRSSSSNVLRSHEIHMMFCKRVTAKSSGHGISSLVLGMDPWHALTWH